MAATHRTHSLESNDTTDSTSLRLFRDTVSNAGYIINAE
jgi:hypothetical protein